ncbi:MAG: MoaD/ThiS family protein [Candidatus Bathyarchaeia archaeon]
MNVRVLFHSVLAEVTGTKEASLSLHQGGTVRELFNALSKRYGDGFDERLFDPKTGRIRRFILVTVNGRDIRHLDRLETELGDGDEVTILPMAAGG